MSTRTFAIARAAGVITATVALVTGVTFASLSSSATLSDTTINSATANLTIFDGSTFSATAPGFHIANLIPGTGKEFAMYFKNGGGVDLNLSAHIGTAPTLVGFDNNSDLTKVLVTITNDKNGQVTNLTLNDLVSGTPVLNGNPLHAGAQGNSGAAGTEGNFHIKFDIDPTAVHGSSASVSSFNITFTGTQP